MQRGTYEAKRGYRSLEDYRVHRKTEKGLRALKFDEVLKTVEKLEEGLPAVRDANR